MTEHYDVVIIGSGAGGGTMAYALANSGRRVLVVERGDYVAQEAENWSPSAVWKDGRYRANEKWADLLTGTELSPYTHYCVGGNTKFWGTVLFRMRREDFGAVAHWGGTSPAWPIDYDTLEPYYRQAEQLYHVHGKEHVDPSEPPRGPYPFPPVPHEDRIASIVARLQRLGLHPFPLPLGLLDECIHCDTCNSFPCRIHAKSDAEVCAIQPARRLGVEVWTNAFAGKLVCDATGTRVEAVDVIRDGQPTRVGASLAVVSCGAVNSAALLLRSNDRHRDGLANSSGLVGRRYMAHQATMLSARSPFLTNRSRFQKTVAINDFYFGDRETTYPLGQIQSQGRTHAITLKSQAPGRYAWIPLPAWEWWAKHSVDWLVMSEDLPDTQNRVIVDADGSVRLHYCQNNVRPHRQLVKKMKRTLRRLGFAFVVEHALGTKNTTHQCGTVVFGTDPRQSVLDPYCRSHDVENLFVVDASFFPSSSAVNPGLTIVAQALRVADHIKSTHLT